MKKILSFCNLPDDINKSKKNIVEEIQSLQKRLIYLKKLLIDLETQNESNKNVNLNAFIVEENITENNNRSITLSLNYVPRKIKYKDEVVYISLPIHKYRLNIDIINRTLKWVHDLYVRKEVFKDENVKVDKDLFKWVTIYKINEDDVCRYSHPHRSNVDVASNFLDSMCTGTYCIKNFVTNSVSKPYITLSEFEFFLKHMKNWFEEYNIQDAYHRPDLEVELSLNKDTKLLEALLKIVSYKDRLNRENVETMIKELNDYLNALKEVAYCDSEQDEDEYDCTESFIKFVMDFVRLLWERFMNNILSIFKVEKIWNHFRSALIVLTLLIYRSLDSVRDENLKNTVKELLQMRDKYPNLNSVSSIHLLLNYLLYDIIILYMRVRHGIIFINDEEMYKYIDLNLEIFRKNTPGLFPFHY